jgi:hypothetical protein
MSTTELPAVSPKSPPMATTTPTNGGQDGAATIVQQQQHISMSTTEVLAASPQAPLTATPTPTGGGQDAAATNKTIATATEDHQPQQPQQHQQQLQPSNMSTTEVLAVSPQSPPTATATPTGGGQDAAAAIETTTTATKQKALSDLFDQPINSRNTAHRMNVSTSKSIMKMLEKEAVREGYVKEMQATYEAKERLSTSVSGLHYHCATAPKRPNEKIHPAHHAVDKLKSK